MKNISIISSKAEDILLDKNHNIIKKQAGGPLLFLENTMKILNVPFHSFYGKVIPVEIIPSEKGEIGRVTEEVSQQQLPINQLSDWTIISTIGKEWNLNLLTQENSKVFLDIQGYVRSYGEFGKKNTWKDSRKYEKYIYCMKGTSDEVYYLPQDVLGNQKLKLLIITDSNKEIEVWHKGEKNIIPVENKIILNNTIGAGDTFFGFFVGYLFLGYQLQKALVLAVEKTSDFLIKSQL